MRSSLSHGHSISRSLRLFAADNAVAFGLYFSKYFSVCQHQPHSECWPQCSRLQQVLSLKHPVCSMTRMIKTHLISQIPHFMPQSDWRRRLAALITVCRARFGARVLSPGGLLLPSRCRQGNSAARSPSYKFIIMPRSCRNTRFQPSRC